MRAVRSSPRLITLLDLLTELQQTGSPSEQALVAMALDRILTGRVVLCGIYSLGDHCAESCGDSEVAQDQVPIVKH